MTVRRTRMDIRTRLSINVMEMFGMVMNAYVMTVIKGHGPEQEEESVEQ